MLRRTNEKEDQQMLVFFFVLWKMGDLKGRGYPVHTGAKIESWRAIFSPWESPFISERSPQDCETE